MTDDYVCQPSKSTCNNKIKTGKKNQNETKNDLFADWVPPIGIKEN